MSQLQTRIHRKMGVGHRPQGGGRCSRLVQIALEFLANEAIVSGKKMIRPEVGRHRILVVDDEPTVRDAIKMLLSFEGHDVETAGSGPDALALIQKEQFDLILTDYAMPAMTGEELATAIKAARPKQPVGMITAYAPMLQASGEPLKGVDFVISKPFALPELRAALARALPGETN